MLRRLAPQITKLGISQLYTRAASKPVATHSLKELCDQIIQLKGIKITSFPVKKGFRSSEHSWKLHLPHKPDAASFSVYKLDIGDVHAKSIYTEPEIRNKGYGSLLIANALLELDDIETIRYFLTGPMSPDGEQCFGDLDNKKFPSAVKWLENKLNTHHF